MISLRGMLTTRHHLPDLAAPSVSHGGFSLVEVTLAIGVIAFALVGIMALFPAATKAAQESQQETRATFIAQQIFGDLTANPPGNATIGLGAGFAPNPATNVLRLNLATNGTNVLSFDAEGTFLRTNAPASFALANPDATFLTQVSIQTNGLLPGLSRVEVLVTAPGSAPLTNRSRYPFITLLRNQ